MYLYLHTRRSSFVILTVFLTLLLPYRFAIFSIKKGPAVYSVDRLFLRLCRRFYPWWLFVVTRLPFSIFFSPRVCPQLEHKSSAALSLSCFSPFFYFLGLSPSFHMHFLTFLNVCVHPPPPCKFETLHTCITSLLCSVVSRFCLSHPEFQWFWSI